MHLTHRFGRWQLELHQRAVRLTRTPKPNPACGACYGRGGHGWLTYSGDPDWEDCRWCRAAPHLATALLAGAHHHRTGVPVLMSPSPAATAATPAGRSCPASSRSASCEPIAALRSALEDGG